ncbi:alpha/beta hydrolase [Bifidobacterium sp. 82T24]|uniref:alpha/beta fold hydrolase n=1 Tax=Bifidobacterium pluvialisilvae TaxID=2834436 RepID=UPI001C59F4FD|nr:alpha/beta hydrolase [Bifidobacterium pluvialisilvae]MBW3088590.1 alpha/beta hydrolase [Bifidobacterium pluvialisilvae]
MNASSDYRFPRVPQFGPFDTPDCLRTFGIDCSVGRLTAVGTHNLDAAERVAVFIPGFTGSKEDFIPFFPQLWKELGIREGARRTTAIMAYSQRGQADSAAPDRRDAYALSDFVADGCEVLERLGARERPVDLVGHSFGGVVARRIAVRRPDLLRSLTVFDSGARPVNSTPLFEVAPMLLRLFGSMLLYYAYRPIRDEPQPDRYAELFRQCMHATSKYHLASVAGFMTKYADVTGKLRTLRRRGLPINIMYGEDDDVWPNSVYEHEAAMLGVEPVVFADAAHIPTIDQPERFAAALADFWHRS